MVKGSKAGDHFVFHCKSIRFVTAHYSRTNETLLDSGHGSQVVNQGVNDFEPDGLDEGNFLHNGLYENLAETAITNSDLAS